MNGTLSHAIADHPWETGRRQFRDWPPLVCPKNTTPGSRGGWEEEKEGTYGEKEDITFPAHLLFAWHLTFITEAMRWILLLLLRKQRLRQSE